MTESVSPPAPGNKSEQVAWYFYDWANSAYYTTVVTLFLGPWLTVLANAGAQPDGYIYPLGIPVAPGAYWPYLVSLSVFTQVLVMPFLGALADYGSRKKEFLGAFAYIGAAATVGLFFTEGDAYLFAGALFLISNLSFGCSIVMYNGFLPEIATPEERDAVSSKGWGIGYLGGGLLLALNLFFYARAEAFGVSEALAVRISLASAGLWWAGFTLIPLARLRNRGPHKSRPPGVSYPRLAWRQLSHTLRDIRNYPHTLLFLLAFLVYNDGIQTVIALASVFGQEELGLSMGTLTSVILMVQFVAFIGTLLFNWIAKVINNKRAVMLSLVIWTLVLIYAYAAVTTAAEFYAMAVVIGLVLGGSQALSRSIFSFMIPKGREAEYFSLYEISDKGTSWMAPLLFGLVLQFTGSYRTAILTLIVYFIVGFILLAMVDMRRAATESGNALPEP
ncbi:MAG: MFS transporter [Bryobacteraceae bacterium]